MSGNFISNFFIFSQKSNQKSEQPDLTEKIESKPTSENVLKIGISEDESKEPKEKVSELEKLCEADKQKIL